MTTVWLKLGYRKPRPATRNMPGAGVATTGFSSSAGGAMAANRPFAPVIRSNRDRTTTHDARYPGRFSVPTLIVDYSQRLALDQQQVGDIEWIFDYGLWRAIDERRNVATRQFGLGQCHQS
jgi:hypothetical protein